MEPEIIFKQTAFKHHIVEADIRWAVKTARYEELMESFDDKYLLLREKNHGVPGVSRRKGRNFTKNSVFSVVKSFLIRNPLVH